MGGRHLGQYYYRRQTYTVSEADSKGGMPLADEDEQGAGTSETSH